MIGRKLLDLALDPRLRRIFDIDRRPPEDIRVQLRLAGAIAADGVDVDAGADHVVGEDRCVGLVGGHRGDDLCAQHGGLGAVADLDLETVTGEVAGAALAGRRINVMQPQMRDAEQRLEGKRLKLGLCAIADQRHCRRAGRGQMPRRHREVAAVRSAVRIVISVSSSG